VLQDEGGLMLFVGIDPSLTGTAVVVLEDDNPEPVDFRMCRVGDSRGLDRVLEIEKLMARAIYEPRLARGLATPVLVAIEHYSYGSKFNVVDLVQLGTVLRLSLIRRQYPYLDPSPGQVKKFAGIKGKTKPKAACETLWGFKPKNGDIADAYVLAQIARASRQKGLHLTSQQREVVASCRAGYYLAA
jgi:Holliday junction resolvasome RuvABC endonuclease subunit